MTAVVAASAPRTRAVLSGYARTLLVPLAGVSALIPIWIVSGAGGWPAAMAAVGGWALLAGVWLRRCGWSRWRAHEMAWAAPLALLAPAITAGWVSPDGLVLWAPIAGLCTIALTVTHR